MKRGFTLVELLVVIGIIGILSGILMATLGGSRDSALAAKCLANMKNLSTAAQSYGMDCGAYPLAGSILKMSVDTSQGKGNRKIVYHEAKGWISWDSQGYTYPSASKQFGGSIGFLEDNDEKAKFAVTNGALWKYVSGDFRIYQCPIHVKKASPVGWSYVMNAAFGYTADESRAYSSQYSGKIYQSMGNKDKVLLFAEIPFQGVGSNFPEGKSGDDESDGILQYPGCGDHKECVGANHKSGNRWYAHVVFADGHTEKFETSGMSEDGLRDLTKLLCEGKDITREGDKYVELK